MIRVLDRGGLRQGQALSMFEALGYCNLICASWWVIVPCEKECFYVDRMV